MTLEHGLTTSRSALADTLNAAAAAAAKTVGLLDSSKFGRSSLLSIRPATALDLLITDDGLDPVTADEFRAAGVKLLIAERLRSSKRPSSRTGGSCSVCVSSSRRCTGGCSGPRSLMSSCSRAAVEQRAQPGGVHEGELGEVDPHRVAVRLGQRGGEHGLAHQVQLADQAQQ